MTVAVPTGYFRWQVPADGDYAIRVADHLNRGGPQFVYRIEFQEVKPSLNVGIPASLGTHSRVSRSTCPAAIASPL
jgi:hypothetical protein